MNEKSSTAHREEISELLKELVITRIEAQMPSNLKMSIGSYGNLEGRYPIKISVAKLKQSLRIDDGSNN